MCYCNPEVRTPFCDRCAFKLFEDLMALKKGQDATSASAVSKQAEIIGLQEQTIALYSAEVKRCWDVIPELKGTDDHYELHEAIMELKRKGDRLAKALEPFAEGPTVNTDFWPCHSGFSTREKCERCGNGLEAFNAIEEWRKR